MSARPTIYFHLPPELQPIVAAHSLASFPDVYPEIERRGFSTVGCWIVRTGYELAAQGVDCAFTSATPREGILVGTSQTTSYLYRPDPRVLYVHVVADASAPHPYAQVNLVQNRTQANGRCLFMEHWPQAGVIPRAASRAGQVVNVAYMGDPVNMAPEFRDTRWQQALAELGFKWIVKPSSAWHDYSDVDVVVAVRAFGARHLFDNKPASKLYNAWLGGVPALLGQESAYRAERTNALDYIEIASAEDTLAALNRLRTESGLFARMVVRADERAALLRAPAFQERWLRLVDSTLVPLYDQWRTRSATARTTYFASRYVALRYRGMVARLGARP